MDICQSAALGKDSDDSNDSCRVAILVEATMVARFHDHDQAVPPRSLPRRLFPPETWMAQLRKVWWLSKVEGECRGVSLEAKHRDILHILPKPEHRRISFAFHAVNVDKL